MRKAERIEAELAEDRDVLRGQLTALEAQLAPSALVGQAKALLGHAGRDLGHRALETARDNPGPTAVTGLGLAWLAVSAMTRTSRPAVTYDDTEQATAKGLRAPASGMAGFDARVAAADREIKSNQAHYSQEGDVSMTDSTHPQSRLSHAKERVYESAEHLRARVEDGLDGLPDGARDRIRQAREAAISVHARAEAEARRAAAAARATAHDNPLLVGALALAAGAALAAMLPRTQVEDRTIGGHRDRLFDEADRVFREEKAKLTSAAEAVAETVVADGQARVREVLSGEKGDDTTPDTTPDASGAAAGKPGKASRTAGRTTN